MADSLSWYAHPHSLDSNFSVSDVVFVAAAASQGMDGVSDDCSVGLIHLPAGSEMPQHGEDAHVVLRVASGGGTGASVGETPDNMSAVSIGDVVSFLPGAPKVIKSSRESPLVLYYSRLGPDLKNARFWFAKNDPSKYRDIYDKINIFEYYQKFVGDYEEVMRGWGYCVPEVTVDAIEKFGGVADRNKEDLRVLDLGCGDGLVGEGLRKRGYIDITGVDFSQPMLDKSSARGCYAKLVRTDLLKELPFEKDMFDILVSTAVTTYLEPHVLSHWLDVCKPGGIVVFTHKTSIWDEWEKEQHRLEAEEARWKKVWELDPPIPYLPSLATNEGISKEMAKIYIYRKMEEKRSS